MFALQKLSLRKTLMLSATGAAIMLSAPSAMAQIEDATGTADPGRASEELLNVEDMPELMPAIEIEDTMAQSAPANAGEITFTLKTLSVEGVGAYNAKDIDYLYRDKIGETVTLQEIYEISGNLTRKYRNDGYILTQVVVPPQTIDGGNVKLRVVEGFVDQVIVQGDGESETEIAKIRQYAENLKRDGILDAQQLERYLLIINDLPGVNARGILSPSDTTPGASDLTITVERNTYDAEISVDNYGSRYLGPYQVSYSGSLNSALGYNEQIRTQLVMAGDKDNHDELLFGSIVYEQPISRYGTKIRFIGSATATEPGDDLEQFDVRGHSQYAAASVIHPFIRSRTMNLTSRATFDVRDVESKNNIEPDTRKDRIRSVRLGSTFQFMDTFLSVGVNAIDLEISQGIDVFGASEEGDSNMTRAAGDPQYTKAELQLQRLQRLTPSLNLLVAGQGQWSANPLLSSEEFGVGGLNFGRGYDSSEIVGDDGISGKLELQWNEPRKIQYINDYQLFAYVDAGRVWNQDATTSDGKRESLTSTGLGMRADITEDTKASVGMAIPLTRRVDTTNDTDPRYYFSLSHTF